MRIALLSDVHANLPALEAVLETLEHIQPDAVYGLGDLVGYAPWPNEVIALVRKHRIATLAGNYDLGVGLNSNDCGCAYKTEAEAQDGAASIAFTNRVITEDNRAYLRHLPRHIRLEYELEGMPLHLLWVHGSPRRVNEYLFEDRSDDSLDRMMQAAHASVLAFGHTHQPWVRRLPPLGLLPHVRWAVNTGSVGKPKDGDPRAGFTLLTLDWEAAADQWLQIEHLRVPYDVERAAQGILQSDLPPIFAERLRTAR